MNFPNEILDWIIKYCDTDTLIYLYGVSKGIRYLTSRYISRENISCSSIDEAYLHYLYYSRHDYIITINMFKSFMDGSRRLTPGKLSFYSKIINKELNNYQRESIEQSIYSYIENKKPYWQQVFYFLFKINFPYIRESSYALFIDQLSVSELSRNILMNMAGKYLPAIFACWNIYESDCSSFMSRKSSLEYKHDSIITDFPEALSKYYGYHHGNLDYIWNYISGKEELFPRIHKFLLNKRVHKPHNVNSIEIKPKLNYPINESTLKRIISFDMKQYFIDNYVKGDRILKLNTNIIQALITYKPRNITKLLEDIIFIKYDYVPSNFSCLQPTKSFVINNVDLDIFKFTDEDAQYLIDHDLTNLVDRLILMNLHPNIIINSNEDIPIECIDYTMQIIDIVSSINH